MEQAFFAFALPIINQKRLEKHKSSGNTNEFAPLTHLGVPARPPHRTPPRHRHGGRHHHRRCNLRPALGDQPPRPHRPRRPIRVDRRRHPHPLRRAGLRPTLRRLSAHRRGLRLPQGDPLPRLRIPLGLGHVLERPLRHHRRLQRHSRPLRGLVYPARRYRHPRRRHRRHPHLLLRQLPRRPPGQHAADRRHHLEGRRHPDPARHGRLPRIEVPSGSRARLRRPGVPSGSRGLPRIRPRRLRRPLRLPRMAHGHLHRRRNPRPRPHHPARPAHRPPPRPRPLRPAQRRLSLPAPHQPRDRLPARRGRRRPGRRRTPRRVPHLRPRHPLRHRRPQRRDPGRTAHVLRHGPRRPRLPLARFAAPRHRAPGPLVVHPGRHRHLPRPLHPRHLYRVALLRPHGDRSDAPARPPGLCPGHLRHRRPDRRRHPDRRRPHASRHRPAHRRVRIACLSLLACPSLIFTTTSIRRPTWTPCAPARAPSKSPSTRTAIRASTTPAITTSPSPATATSTSASRC